MEVRPAEFTTVGQASKAIKYIHKKEEDERESATIDRRHTHIKRHSNKDPDLGDKRAVVTNSAATELFACLVLTLFFSFFFIYLFIYLFVCND